MPEYDYDDLKDLPLNEQTVKRTDDPIYLFAFHLLFFIIGHLQHLWCRKGCNSAHLQIFMLVNMRDKSLPHLFPILKCLVVVLKLDLWALLNHVKFLGRLGLVVFIWRGAHFYEAFTAATSNAPSHSARTWASLSFAEPWLFLFLYTRMKHVAQSARILKFVLNRHRHEFILAINERADLLWNINRCFLQHWKHRLPNDIVRALLRLLESHFVEVFKRLFTHEFSSLLLSHRSTDLIYCQLEFFKLFILLLQLDFALLAGRG